MTHIKYCKCSVYSNIFVLVYSLRPVLRLIIDRVKQKIIILYTMSLLLTYWTMTSCVRTWSATCTWRFMQWNLLMLAYSLFVWSNITYNCNEIVLLAARSNWRILSVKNMSRTILMKWRQHRSYLDLHFLGFAATHTIHCSRRDLSAWWVDLFNSATRFENCSRSIDITENGRILSFFFLSCLYLSGSLETYNVLLTMFFISYSLQQRNNVNFSKVINAKTIGDVVYIYTSPWRT